MQEIRNSACNKCELGDHCRDIKAQVCTVGEGSKNASLMIVAEAPDRDDATDGTVMRSVKDKLLRRVLVEGLGVKASDVYITYLIKCKPEGQTTVDQANACQDYLYAEIEAVKPKVILTLGDMALFQFTEGKTSNLMRIRGQVMIKEINGHKFKLIPTLSCGHVGRMQSQFKNFAFDVEKAVSEASGTANKNRRSQHKIVETIEEYEEIVGYIKEVGQCTFDFEALNLELHSGREVNKATGIALSINPGQCWFVPLEHYDSPFKEKDVFYIMNHFCENVLENYDIDKCAHNLGYDLHVARFYRPELRPAGRYDDTMLMKHLYDETTKNGLKECIREWFRPFGNYEQVLEDKYGKQFYDKATLKELAEYACYDGDLTGRLKVLLENWLLMDERLYRVYRNEVMAAFKPIWRAEAVGVLIDKDFLFDAIRQVEGLIAKQERKLRNYSEVKRFEAAMSKHLNGKKIKELEERQETLRKSREERDAKRLIEYEAKKKKIAPFKKSAITATESGITERIQLLKTGGVSMYEGMNFGSSTQLSKLFYTVEGFGFEQVYDEKGDTYLTGTGKEVVIDIEDETGFIEDLQVWRSLDKTLSTYLEGINKRVDANSRLHTSFLQHGTVTGRLSSRNPNLQNLPNEGKIQNEDVMTSVRLVKKSIIVPEGYTLVQIDYSQAELRLMAEFSEDETMIGAYNDNIDLHALTAANIMKISLEEFYKLDKDMQKKWRTRAKAGNFGLIYGMGAKGFQQYAKVNYGVHLSLTEAEDTRDTFFRLYKKLPLYHELYIKKAQKFGYVRTMTGRKRNLPDIHSHNGVKRSMDERAAINSPIQGTGGGMTIQASAFLSMRLDERVVFVLNIHDALYYYVPNDILDASIKVMKKTTENLPIEQFFGKGLKHVTMKVDIETSTKNLKETAPYVFPENN